MTKRQQFDDLVKKAKKIVVTTHQNPDPDGLCSALGVSVYLDKVFPEKKYKVLVNGKAFTGWDWLASFKKIKWVEEIANELTGADLLIMTDGNRLERFSNEPDKIRAMKLKTICIDHHLGEPEGFSFDLIDQSAMAACQIVTDILFDDEKLLDKETCEILLTGIFSDSGMFRYLTPQLSTVLLTVKKLVDAGRVDIQTLAAKTQRMNQAELELLKILFAKTHNIKMKKYPNLTYSFLPLEIRGKYSDEDIGNAYHRYLDVVVRQVKDHPWGFVVAPKRGDKIGISFRSLPEGPDVRRLAEKYFYGGGHSRASGGEYRTEEEIGYDEVCRRVIEILDRKS